MVLGYLYLSGGGWGDRRECRPVGHYVHYTTLACRLVWFHAMPSQGCNGPLLRAIIYLPYCTALHCMALAMALQSSMAMASAWLHLRLRLPLGLPLLLLLLLNLLNLLNLLFARLPFPFVACTPLDDYVLKPDANYRRASLTSQPPTFIF